MSDPRKSPYYVKDCKCGCPIGFMKNTENKLIPVDLRAHVYAVTGEKNPGEAGQVVRTEICFVSHFFTCPLANNFSGGKKQ